ncbi:DotA/TraY family protein [Salinicola rhizosphaerae]|uniref:DotA/TraY family protein n=1 Tax=Salinicola rhizosphaerae TaxID=1443141 RepID=A0ABQ3DRC8_9GAMM|nr:DotA/TraY family protein [Salinicola rhizosphaerae]GHB12977.1 hypothetical protein GCM10009038_08790 [Salinicola rhizosphaerae]
MFFDGLMDQPGGVYWQALELIFGGWINTPWEGTDTSYTIMTVFMGSFNLVSWFMVAISLGIGILMGVVGSANEGKWGGSLIDPTWFALRTVFGLALLSPITFGPSLPYGAYVSYVNVLAVWVAGVGSNIADKFTYFAMDNIMSRGVDIGSEGNGFLVMDKLLKQSMCMNAFARRYENVYSEQFYNRGAGTSTPFTRDYNAVTLTDPDTIVELGPSGMCGSIGTSVEVDDPTKFGESESLSAVIAPKVKNLNLEYLLKVHSNITNAVGAGRYTSGQLEEWINRPASNPDVVNAVNRAGERFNQYAHEYDAKLKAIVANELRKAVEGKGLEVKMVGGQITLSMTEESVDHYGWGLLGPYYSIMSKKLSQINDNISIASNSVSFSLNMNKACAMSSSGFIDMIFGNKDNCNFLSDYNVGNIIINSAKSNARLSGDTLAQASTACSTEGCDDKDVKSLFNNIMSGPFIKMYGHFSQPMHFGAGGWFFGLFMSDGDSGTQSTGMVGLQDGIGGVANREIASTGLQIGNPLMFSASLGQSMIMSSNIINTILSGVQATVEAVSNSAISWFGGAVIGGLMYWVSILKILNGVMSVYGMALGYLIPMAPTLVFAMGFLATLTVTSIAITISGLVPATAFKPEGKGMSGQNLGRTIGYFWTLLLKAPFHVTGFILSMFVVNIAFVYYNQIFFMSFSEDAWSFNPFAIVGMATIYIGGLVTLLHTGFKITNVFADVALDFVAGKDYSMGNNIDNISTDRVSQMQTEVNRDSKMGNFGQSVGTSIGNKINAKRESDNKS